jgi:hypothetical protein
MDDQRRGGNAWMGGQRVLHKNSFICVGGWWWTMMVEEAGMKSHQQTPEQLLRLGSTAVGQSWGESRSKEVARSTY